MLTIKNRPASFLIVALVYAVAAAVGILVYTALPSWPMPFALLAADALATAAVFLFSLLFGNASVYDPYWSVQPPVILAAFIIGSGGASGAGILICVPIALWAIRLTVNWAYTFRGLHCQDWRYTMLSEKSGALYPLVNFCGIHMFPTLVVYACTLPAVYAVLEGGSINALTVIGALISTLAVLLQLVADAEMQAFRKHGTGGFIRVGLWKNSRHPNYLGEILMWWGVAIASVSVLPGQWYLLLGALLNTLMFLFISIPLADGRQRKKPGYTEYRAATRHLLPIPKHSK